MIQKKDLSHSANLSETNPFVYPGNYWSVPENYDLQSELNKRSLCFIIADFKNFCKQNFIRNSPKTGSKPAYGLL